MKKLLLNCDQVFEVLTRGPFPTGQDGDEAVEHHLRACYDCRRLAEALRPAVELLHEAVAADQAIDLPEYQGSLLESEIREREPIKDRTLARGVRRIANPPKDSRQDVHRYDRVVNAVRLMAASILVAALGILLYGISISPSFVRQSPDARGSIAPQPTLARYLPDEEGLLTLVSLNLPDACLPAHHRPLLAEDAANLLAAIEAGSLETLRCCTECHRAKESKFTSESVVIVTQQNCQVCHRG